MNMAVLSNHLVAEVKKKISTVGTFAVWEN
jgi:hypothetical protein